MGVGQVGLALLVGRESYLPDVENRARKRSSHDGGRAPQGGLGQDDLVSGISASQLGCSPCSAIMVVLDTEI